MPLIKKIINSNSREVVIKWVGNGTDTLTLSSLVVGTQTVSGTPFVTIQAVAVTQGSSGVSKLTRNNQDTFIMSGYFDFQFSSPISVIVDENGTNDIVVNMSNDGTLILKVKKMHGYTGI